MSEQSTPPFHTEGIVGPLSIPAGTMLADSGALAEGAHSFSYICMASVQARIQFEWRNSGGAAKHIQPLVLAAAQPFMHTQSALFTIECAEGDHFVIVTGPGAIVGLVQAALCVS